MKEITAFYLHGCPYCQKAKQAVQELIQDHPAYGAISLRWYEESEYPEIAQKYSYYYVPSMFIGNEKMYEAQPGQTYDEIKGWVQSVLEKALK